MVLNSLRKTFLGCKTCKRLLRSFTSRKGRGIIYSYKSSKVSAVSKGRSEAYCYYEACLKFSEAGGCGVGIKAIVINTN